MPAQNIQVIDMTVQERIAELLKINKWSKYRLAKEAGFYPTTVYDWFNEKHYTPDRNSIESVCLAFGISQAEFYSSIDETKLNPEQTALLELFSKIPDNKKGLVFELLRSFAQKD